MSETKKEKAWYVVRAIGGKEHKVKEYLDELAFLADTAGAVPVKNFIQKCI